LLRHWLRRAASRAAWTAGSNSAINTAMMAMTTKSSISVNPDFLGLGMTVPQLRMRQRLLVAGTRPAEKLHSPNQKATFESPRSLSELLKKSLSRFWAAEKCQKTNYAENFFKSVSFITS
jgi:hypothetical protein